MISAMKLCRLIYLSRAAGPISAAKLTELVRKSSESNHARGLTGLLLYSGGHFMQVLEGDEIQLTSLYAKITADPRHTELAKLQHADADERLFPDWGMQLVNTDASKSFDRDRLDKLFLRFRLSRQRNDADEALAILTEFRDQFRAAKAA